MTSGTARPPTREAHREHDCRRRQERRGRPDTCRSSRDRDEHRADASEVQALQGIHVTDHPRHEIALTESLELSRSERLDSLVEPGADTPERP